MLRLLVSIVILVSAIVYATTTNGSTGDFLITSNKKSSLLSRQNNPPAVSIVSSGVIKTEAQQPNAQINSGSASEPDQLGQSISLHKTDFETKTPLRSFFSSSKKSLSSVALNSTASSGGSSVAGLSPRASVTESSYLTSTSPKTNIVPKYDEGRFYRLTSSHSSNVSASGSSEGSKRDLLRRFRSTPFQEIMSENDSKEKEDPPQDEAKELEPGILLEPSDERYQQR